jgi:type I restriction-modification system DNA methylase subunit
LNPVERNTKIQAFIQRKDAAGELYLQSDKDFIAAYEGAGGLASKGASGQGLLHEFYTPEWLCAKMWELARYHGYTKGAILEPSCATGRFFKDAPTGEKMTGFEINPISARIAQILYPEARIYPEYFETAFLQPDRFTSLLNKQVTWLEDYPFSLVISNPPYGKHVNQFSSYFKSPKFQQMETFFIYHGLRLLKPGGLLVYVTSSNIIRSGISYQKEKEQMAELAELVDAYRLPPVFRHSQVPTDIIILKKRS